MQTAFFRSPRKIPLIILLVAVAGCAAAARSDRMAAQGPSPAPAALRERLAVTDVTSSKNAEVAADNLRQAVELSLQKAGYLNANPPPRRCCSPSS